MVGGGEARSVWSLGRTRPGWERWARWGGLCIGELKCTQMHFSVVCVCLSLSLYTMRFDIMLGLGGT
jgi:hypothetical protein